MHVHQLRQGTKMLDGTQLVVEDITALDGDFPKVVIRDKSDDGGLYVKNSMFNHGRKTKVFHIVLCCRATS